MIAKLARIKVAQYDFGCFNLSTINDDYYYKTFNNKSETFIISSNELIKEIYVISEMFQTFLSHNNNNTKSTNLKHFIFKNGNNSEI
jgi:hypothetical protein